MSLQSTTLFSMLHERIDWLSQRQRVLAQNIANADTAGYSARDLKTLDFRKTLRSQADHIGLVRTDQKHINATQSRGAYGVEKNRKNYEVSISGNSVVLEQETAKVAATQADYQLASRIFTKYKKMHSLALQGKF